MNSKLLRTAAGWIAAAVLLSVPVQAEPSISAQRAVLLDGQTARVLFAKEADERSLIASTTKIMTGLLIAEDCDLQSEVAVPDEAVGVEGSSLYLKNDEILTVEALLYGLMLHSGNDAAVALAMYHSGSVEAFVDKMNQRAAEIGLEQTHFVNPHGLDAKDHYSTAADLAKLAASAMNNPIFYRIVSTKSVTFGDRAFTNHNKLLWQYDGAVGVKTGYTMTAGRILVSAAERNGRRLIAVTINDRNDWKDHAALLDYGFESFQLHTLAPAGQIMAEIPVLCGAEETVHVVLREKICYPLSQHEKVELRLHTAPYVFAPVLAGEEAGTLEVLIDGVSMMEYPVYWQYSVLEGVSE